MAHKFRLILAKTLMKGLLKNKSNYQKIYKEGMKALQILPPTQKQMLKRSHPLRSNKRIKSLIAKIALKEVLKV